MQDLSIGPILDGENLIVSSWISNSVQVWNPETRQVVENHPEFAVPLNAIRFQGDRVRYLNPDERSAGSLIKKALEMNAGPEFRESTKGVSVRMGGLERLLAEHSFALLDEGGEDIRAAERLPGAYLLSDHLNLDEDEMALVGELPRYSVGPRSLHADHTITVLLNELDRREP